MSALEKLTRELSAAMNWIPGPLCGRMAWRIHPSDHARVCKELKEFCYDRQQDYRPLYALHILGVRIYKDKMAPRL